MGNEKWAVKTNVHPECNGDSWGWVGRDCARPDAIFGLSIHWTGKEGYRKAKIAAKAPELLDQLKAMYDFYETLAMKINSEDFDEKFRDQWNYIMTKTETLLTQATTLP